LKTTTLDALSDDRFESRFKKMEPFASTDTALQVPVIDTANFYSAGNALIISKTFTASRHAAGHDSSPELFSRFLR
jgi:hypothetical protein